MKGRVIGMVQTRPLPGSYRNRGERISFITEQALEETRILAECGVQSVILQNMGDMPIRQQSTPEAIAYLSVVAQAIRRSFPALCLGVLVNWDGVAALAVADAAGADFVRVEHLYTGAEVTSAGLLQGQCCEITALKRKLGTDIPVYADVWERHGIPLCPQPLDEAAWQCVHEAFADGLFLCGKNAQESLSMARQVRQRVPGIPLFLGGGATGDNVRELLQEYDAVCVATWIKNGDMRNPVDPDRTRYTLFYGAGRSGRGRHMNIIPVPNYEALSCCAADIVEAQIRQKPDTCLGTVTGSSPEGMYRELVRRHREKGLELSRIRTVNTDEYAGLSGTHPQSYRYYLEEHFFRPCGIPSEHTAVPQGDAADPEAECRRYEALCRSHPADLQILGVGHTGHIGFNEPADDFPELTHLVDLAPQTLAANARYFDDPDTMPRQAITVGLGVLMRAKRILLLLSGSGKAEITERLLCGRIVPQVPATILRLHPDVTAVIDEDALQLVRAHAPNLIPYP